MNLEGFVMTTSDVLSEQALSLARTGAVGEDAIDELLVASGERRVAVVRARPTLLGLSGEQDEAAASAVALLDAVLSRLPIWIGVSMDTPRRPDTRMPSIGLRELLADALLVVGFVLMVRREPLIDRLRGPVAASDDIATP